MFTWIQKSLVLYIKVHPVKVKLSDYPKLSSETLISQHNIPQSGCKLILKKHILKQTHNYSLACLKQHYECKQS